MYLKRSVLPRAIMALGLFTLYSLTTNSYNSAFYVERSNSNSMQSLFDPKKGLVGIKPKYHRIWDRIACVQPPLPLIKNLRGGDDCSQARIGEFGTRRGKPLYMTYRYILPRRVWFLRRFVMKMGIDFCPFLSGIGCGFRGNYGTVWKYSSFQFQINKEEKVIQIRNGF